MTLRFDFTVDDFREFRRRHFRRYRMLWILAILVVCFSGVTLSTFKPEQDHSRFIVQSLLGLVFFSLLFGMYYVRETRLPSGARDVIGGQEMQVTEDGISGIDRYGEGVMKWTGFVKVYNAPQAYYLYQNASIAVIVPKRAFSDSGAMAEFEELLRNKVRKIDS